MPEYTAFPLLQRLQAILTENPPYCCGILELPPDNFELYYGKEDARYEVEINTSMVRLSSLRQRICRFVNLSKPHDNGALEALAQACKPAKCARGSEDTVPDQASRARARCKAMDPEEFVTRFDVEATGLLDTVRLALLSKDDQKPERALRAELHKLHVHGEHSAGAARDVDGPRALRPYTRKDTPCSQSTAFASLVVVFPTAHSGGALLLRHDDKQFTFDPSALRLLAGRTTRASVAYLAFTSASAVEPALAPVLAGHRVSLTYSLSYVEQEHWHAPPTGSIEVLQPSHANTSALTAALAALLADPAFMPQGGTLGFGLRHRGAYALPKVWTRDVDVDVEDPLDSLKAQLTGSDAALCAACTALGVPPRLRLLCRGPELELGDGDGDGDAIVLDHMEDLGDGVESAAGALLGRGGVRVRSCAFTGDAGDPWVPVRDRECGSGEVPGPERLVVHWVTKPGEKEKDGPRSAYATWGDEAALCWLCTSVCVLVEIGSYGDRSKKLKAEGVDDEDIHVGSAYGDEGELEDAW
ncbi:hypothetical protein GSI_04762 [Ganoderma sinense ZZ0214-1]|uniref:Uncharacterized protein n=1 Tax=Ganoderma sinense ZZ0214-1 TaxID=1077348 RepID=A0A2G8SHT5_9APHY|nr:hypothetical protein GSI_04762 [Ganoderma sinense ZZ0214-1]